MTITEFLLARIAEDEAAAQEWSAAYNDPGRAPGYHYSVMRKHREEWPTLWRSLDRFLPARVLAECAAKREIVDLWERHRDNRDARRRPRARAAEDEQAAQDRRTQEARARVAEDAMFALAAVYADHPDYLQEWAL